jgi:8-oxo-dGTP diphosphatase
VREVAEETGLVVAAVHHFGARVHPATGRTIIYIGCVPSGSTDVHLGAPHDLAEVRWLTLTEAAQLLPTMFPPVRAYLAEATGPPRATADHCS